MVKLKGGYYAVARGRQIGIYRTWEQCEAQITGFPRSRFKKFSTEAEARDFIEANRTVPDFPMLGGINPNIQGEAASALLNLFMSPPSTSVSPARKRAHTTSAAAQEEASDGRLRMEVGSIPATDDSVFVDDEDDTLLEAFRIFDHDNKGFICTRDLKRVMRRLGDWLTDAEIQEMIIEADRDGDGRVSFEEFYTIVHNDCSQTIPERIQGVCFEDAPVVYTDGACSKNGRTGSRAGWGMWWGEQHMDNGSGPVSGDQTNNRAELEAVMNAINKAIERRYQKLIVRTDSQLLINSMDRWIEKWKRNGWKTADGKNVKNRDLLEILDNLLQLCVVKFEHVPGHAGVKGNEMADSLARGAAASAAAPQSYNMAFSMMPPL